MTITRDPESQPAFLPDLCTARSVLVVVIGGQLLAFVLVLASAYHVGFSYARLGTTSMFVQWVGLTSTAILCLLRAPLNRLSSATASLAIFAVVVVNTLIFSLLARALLNWAMAETGEQIPVFSHKVVLNVAIAAIIAGVVMRYFYVQEQLHARERTELRSRIQALQSRIRPHFLFNSMNTISSLIAVDPEAAEQAVEDLSGLFRASLAQADTPATLEEELALCRRYVRIESLRMGERLTVEWDIRCDDPAELPVPLLTLQPLLENAIYHGIQPLPEGGTVQVHARHENGELVLEVRNPLPAATAGRAQAGNRMALENIRHRLEAMHGPRARLDAERHDNEYRVRIRYPVESQGDNNNAGSRM